MDTVVLVVLLVAVLTVAILLGRTRWGAEPIAVRRGHVVGAALIVGCLSGAGIIVGSAALRNLDREREARAHAIVLAERRRTAARTLDRRQVAVLARRIARQERPTTSDLLRLIRRAAQACERVPSRCAAAVDGFGALAAPVAPGAAQGASSPITPAQAPQAPRAPARRPDRRRQSSSTPAPAAGGSAGGSSAAPAPAPGSPPAPAVTVSPPPLPLPCVGITTPVIGVRCPTR